MHFAALEKSGQDAKRRQVLQRDLLRQVDLAVRRRVANHHVHAGRELAGPSSMVLTSRSPAAPGQRRRGLPGSGAALEKRLLPERRIGGIVASVSCFI